MRSSAISLRDAENDLVEARVIELREAPDLLGDRSYDLSYLRAIHRQIFQDVYDWAGDVRTVGIEKGDESFCPRAASASRWTMSPRRFTASNNSRLFPKQISRAPSRKVGPPVANGAETGRSCHGVVTTRTEHAGTTWHAVAPPRQVSSICGIHGNSANTLLADCKSVRSNAVCASTAWRAMGPAAPATLLGTDRSK